MQIFNVRYRTYIMRFPAGRGYFDLQHVLCGSHRISSRKHEDVEFVYGHRFAEQIPLKGMTAVLFKELVLRCCFHTFSDDL